MAAARTYHVAALLPNGRVFIEGGGSCDLQPNPEVYHPVSGQFTLTGPSAYQDSYLSAVSASLLPTGNVLATLDVGCDIGSGAEVYDSAHGTFAGTAGMTSNRGYNTATLLPEGRVLVAGTDWAHDGGSAELYDSITRVFTAVDGTFPQREELHTATLLPDGSVLLAGGWICCGTSLSTAAIYHPAHPSPSPVCIPFRRARKARFSTPEHMNLCLPQRRIFRLYDEVRPDVQDLWPTGGRAHAMSPHSMRVKI